MMIFRNIKLLVLLLCLFVLSGCATMFSGSGPQAVSIMTEPDGADIEIVNMRTADTIMKVKSPYTAMLERKDGAFREANYYVILTKPGYIEEDVPINSGLAGWTWGNVLFMELAAIPLFIDYSTGAAYSLDNDPIKVKLYPDTPEGKITMAKEKYNGLEHCKNGDYNKAIDDTSKALSLYPEYFEALCTRATAYAAKNEYDKALSDLDKAILLKPDYPDAYKERGKLYSKKEDYAKALEDFNKALALKIDYAEVMFERGKLFYAQKITASAKDDLKAACAMGYSQACNYQF